MHSSDGEKVTVWFTSDLAYLAGFIDGEGCFSTHDNGRGYLALDLRVVNTNLQVLEWIKKTFGGSIQNKPPQNPNWKRAYFWMLTQKGLRVLIPQLLPHLKVKREQAICALGFLESGYGAKEQKLKMRMRIQELNK